MLRKNTQRLCWRMLGLAAVFAISMVSTSCSSLPGFVPPDVTLVNIEFSDLTVFETSGVVTLRVVNENDNPLVVDGGVYNLYLGGMKVGKGLSDQRLEAPRLGSDVLQVPIYINNLALVTRLAKLMEQPEIDYQLKGKLFVERAYGTKKIRLDKVGRLDLENLPGRETLGLGNDDALDLDALPQ